jgi:hypothetical protein
MKYLKILLIIPIIFLISYIIINSTLFDYDNINRNIRNQNNAKNVIEKFESNTSLNLDNVQNTDETDTSTVTTILADRQDYKMGDIPNIEDPIDDAYLSYSSNIFNQELKSIDDNTYEYTIINTYKTILQRNPSSSELNKNINLFKIKELDEEKLKLQLYNTPEYRRLIKMQNNEVESGLEGALAKEELLTKLSKIYYEERKVDVPRKMLLPLKDTFVHLQFDQYLFRAMLIHINYPKFENDILDAALLTREKLLEFFNKYFELSELKSKANDIRKKMLLDMKNELGKIPEASILKKTGAYLNEKGTDLSEQIKNIFNNSNKVFNKDDVSKYLDKNKYKSDLFVRVYDPIKYKQHYRGDPLYRPPICTTLGQKQIVSPVFTDSKMLFHGTDLKEATENTQIGSIMPKFQYTEYQDINVM